MRVKGRSKWAILRACGTMPALLLLGAASPTPSLEQMNDTGRVLATLNDWRAIVFVLLVIIFLQFVERAVTGWRHGKAQDRLYLIVQESSKADGTMSESFRSMSATMARLESVLAHRGETL